MIKRTLITSAAVAGVLGLTAVAGAVPGSGDGGTPTVQFQATQAEGDDPAEEAPDRRRPRHRGRHSIHSELTVRDQDGEGWEQVVVDRGTVSAIDGSSFTLTRPDGETVRVTTDATTEFKGVDGVGDLQADRPTMVVQRDGHVAVVAQADREAIAERRAQRRANRPNRDEPSAPPAAGNNDAA